MTTIAELTQYLERFDGNSNLESVLREDETRPFFKKLYASLQSVFGQSESSHKSSTKRHSPALKKILELESVGLSESLLDRFNEVKINPEMFWESFAAPKSHWTAQDSLDVIVGKAYAACREVSADREWQTIRWRFFTVFFYLLARRLSSTSNVSDKAKSRLLEAINRSRQVVPNPTKEDIEKLVSTGGRYAKFCRELWKRGYASESALNDQYGPLFLLPQIDDSIWEDRRKLQAEEFNTAVSHIYGLDITKQSKTYGASSLAKAILEVAFRPFTWNTSTINNETDNRREREDSQRHIFDPMYAESTVSALFPLNQELQSLVATDSPVQAVTNPEADSSTGGTVPGGRTNECSFTDTRLHWSSEQVFYRCPVTIPYDSPIFVCVQNGDVSGMRELFQSCQVPIDVVDPYGLGLLHIERISSGVIVPQMNF